MPIGQRLRKLRESQKLSQGDIEKRTGLLRCYTSRVENGFTTPNLETLEKYARALEVPLFRLFYEGDEPPEPPPLPRTSSREWGATNKESAQLYKFARLLSRMKQRDRNILLVMAQRMASRR